MPLSPHPQADAVTSRDGLLTLAWSQWLNALRALLNGADTRVTTLEARMTALEARVTALEGP